MKFCLWCMNQNTMVWVPTKLTVDWYGVPLPACMAHVMLVNIERVVCV